MFKQIILSTILGLSCCVYSLSVAPAEKITIDGKLDEPAWQQASKGSKFSPLTQHQAKSFSDTLFSVLADQESIYIGIRCEEPNMSQIRANVHGGNSRHLWADDAVEVYFSPTAAPDEYYQFAVSAGGATYQMFYGEKGVIRPDNYSPVYEAKVFLGKDFWSVEIRIPLEALYMTKSKFWKTDWLFNVSRHQMNPKRNTWSSWSILNNGFNEVERFNKVGKFPMKPVAKDIYIREIAGNLTSPERGELIIRTEQEPAVAGTYTLNIASDDLEPIPSRQVTLQESESQLIISPVSFKRTGSIKITAVLTNAQGQTVAARDYQTSIEFIPMRLNLTAPGYSNAFFPGQKSDRLQGTVQSTLPIQAIRIAQNNQTAEIPVKSPVTAFDIPIQFSGTESLPVKFELLKDGKSIHSHEITIRKLPPLSTTMVWIASPGRLVVNGKNTFIHGWYSGENDWIVSRWLREKFPSQNAKHPVNMTNWVNLQANRLVPGSGAKEMAKDIRPSDKVFAALRKRIEANRNSNFEVYYLEDEPECRGVSPVYLKYLYEYIKELDPYHPVMIISRDPGKYLDCADILNPHPYLSPIVNENGERLLKTEVETIRRRCKTISDSGKKNKIIMLTPQAFSYNIKNSYADYTNFDESNASIWSAVCHGAQGVTSYIWYAHHGRPSLNFGMDYIYSSLDRLNSLLASPEIPLSLNSDNPLIDAYCIGNAGKYLAVIVNVSPRPQEASVKFQSSPPVNNWHVFRESRELSIPVDGQKITLEPYQVVLLTSEKLDQELSSLSDLRRKIDQAEQERCNRGNILFGKQRDIEISSSHSGYTYQSALEQRDCMFDGIIDSISWLPRNYKELWYELSFPKFVPKFIKARVYGNGLDEMTFKIWKYGEWQEPPAQISTGKYYREYDFGNTLSTVKIRMDFKLPKPGLENRFELYEFELLE